MFYYKYNENLDIATNGNYKTTQRYNVWMHYTNEKKQCLQIIMIPKIGLI